MTCISILTRWRKSQNSPYSTLTLIRKFSFMLSQGPTAGGRNVWGSCHSADGCGGDSSLPLQLLLSTKEWERGFSSEPHPSSPRKSSWRSNMPGQGTSLGLEAISHHHPGPMWFRLGFVSQPLPPSHAYHFHPDAAQMLPSSCDRQLMQLIPLQVKSGCCSHSSLHGCDHFLWALASSSDFSFLEQPRSFV